MPPPEPAESPEYRLRLLDRPFKVDQLEPHESIPEEYIRMLTDPASAGGRFISLTRTDEEISIVVESASTQDNKATWSCIKIAGPMDFGVLGVFCNIATPLKAADIPIFAVSTWNTDYILVPKDSAARAVETLTQDGWRFVETSHP
ncbi:ACT domain-containing protein [Trametes gibbosa]|nr:ACT domain-containing protein [Trametes gibbosa]